MSYLACGTGCPGCLAGCAPTAQDHLVPIKEGLFGADFQEGLKGKQWIWVLCPKMWIQNPVPTRSSTSLVSRPPKVSRNPAITKRILMTVTTTWTPQTSMSTETSEITPQKNKSTHAYKDHISSTSYHCSFVIGYVDTVVISSMCLKVQCVRFQRIGRNVI